MNALYFYQIQTVWAKIGWGLGVRIEGKASANVEIYDAFSGEERGMVGYRRDRETGRK